MSVATEFPPTVHIPDRARRRPERTAVVLPFRPRRVAVEGLGPQAVGTLREAAAALPQLYPVRPTANDMAYGSPTRATLRLTGRGYAVLGVLAGLLTAGLLWLAHASVPGSAPPAQDGAAVVTVNEGDTLWSIASRIAPDRDPRTVVASLERINHLSGPIVQPGQVLATR
jgi:hypothetical protein